jgi:steroid Delta-isomerase
MHADSLASIAGFLNGLTPAKLDSLGDVYSPGIEFEDPLHHTTGIIALRRMYEHLFQQLSGITIAVTDIHGDDSSAFLLWTMRYQFRGRERSIQGTSHLKFARDGRIATQRDFWDASFPIYGEFPVIGWAMRGIRKLVSMPGA